MEYVPISKQKSVVAVKNLTNDSTHLLNDSSLLKIRSVNQCIEDAKSRPIPKKLFGEFWYEGELCILFADTNLGKSILSVQIANSISKGQAIRGFDLEASQQKVLYFDFEMSDKQFEKRYSNEYTNHYIFDNNLYRIEINPDCTEFEDFEKELFKSIEKAIMFYNARVLIIDNLTYLKTQATESAKEALPLMKLLKSIKIKYDLSILALAHTPKRNLVIPITKNDLAGSKHLSNFADSIFAIGESCKDKSLRYLKQIKARATEMIYDSENVIMCEINKSYNFLEFEFLNFGNERDHLRIPTADEQSELEQAIISLRSEQPNISNREIANRLNTYPVKVGRILSRINL
jgi:archaellum biogenesis ATPase FlaH